MIRPKPFKFVCQKCKYSKIYQPKRDALVISDVFCICPKCKIQMDIQELNEFDKVLSSFKSFFKIC